MNSTKPIVYLGIDCGATTSKIGGIDGEGEILGDELRQSETRGDDGPAAMIAGWMAGADGYLEEHRLEWEQVAAVGLAIPGPYRERGVLGRQPNLPKTLEGWPFLRDLTEAVADAAGRPVPVATANDGQLAGLAEARVIQATRPGSVILLAPGSGLGGAYVEANGRLLAGDRDAAAILGHMPAPCGRLGLPVFSCGCGRDWGCFEAYTAIAGLPQFITHFAPDFPNHPFARLRSPGKSEALQLRDLVSDGDPLALAIFDKQAEAMGYAVATACMAYDPTHVVIGGGLIDPGATSAGFRKRYMGVIRTAAERYSWSPIEQLTFHEARLGELSQAIGAALIARNTAS